jgi:hypothetical protein
VLLVYTDNNAQVSLGADAVVHTVARNVTSYLWHTQRPQALYSRNAPKAALLHGPQWLARRYTTTTALAKRGEASEIAHTAQLHTFVYTVLPLARTAPAIPLLLQSAQSRSA